MCGIAGFTGLADERLLESMLDRMRYRGPDDRGMLSAAAPEVSLGMCRLSILDLAGGHQPMTTPDGRYTIVFNGEIFNAPELRRTLQAQGAPLRTTHSDTEALLHLYARDGEAMLAQLNGMFAFVILDRVRGRLFGARDRMGIKPLYYSTQGGRLAFASELKCLLCLPWIGRTLDRVSVSHFLSLQFVPAPRSILQDVRKLPAGHSFTYDLAAARLTVSRWWRLPFAPELGVPLATWRERLRETMTAAVRRWTLSDVPIAFSLSGGLDSSAIVGLVAQSGATDLRTFSLGFGQDRHRDCDELDLAKQVAEKWGTRHEEIVLEPETLLDDLERMVWQLDEPYAGGLPSWYVFRQIGQHCKVAMTGVGGDELFGQYAKWRVHERPAWLRLAKGVKESLAWRLPRGLGDALRYPHGHAAVKYLADAQKSPGWLAEPLPPEACTDALLERLWQEAGTAEPRDAYAYLLYQTQLPEEFLLMTDRFSMAHSVEARTPLLDHELVEAVFRMPAALRTRADDPKFLMREIVADLLPPALLTAPKRGFVLPLRDWTRGRLRPLVEDLLGADALRRGGLFNPDLHTRLVRPHLDGDTDHTPQLWTLLMFNLWSQVHAK